MNVNSNQSSGVPPLVVTASALEPNSDDVVATAWRFALLAGFDLVLVHAVAPPHLVPGRPPDPTSMEQLRSEARAALAQQEARLRPAGARPAAMIVEPGPPDLVVGRLLTQCTPALAVLGATTTHGKLGKLLGSTAERLLQTATVPVLVVRDQLPVPPRFVLAVIDASAFSADALRCGVRLLARLVDAAPADSQPAIRGEVLTVVQPPEVAADRYTALGEGRARTEALAAEVCGRAMRWIPRVLAGEPRHEILRTLEEIDCDLLLLGSRGQGGLRRALGTVATDLAREAPVSVLLVPPPAAMGEAIASAVDDLLAPRWPGPAPHPR